MTNETKFPKVEPEIGVKVFRLPPRQKKFRGRGANFFGSGPRARLPAPDKPDRVRIGPRLRTPRRFEVSARPPYCMKKSRKNFLKKIFAPSINNPIAPSTNDGVGKTNQNSSTLGVIGVDEGGRGPHREGRVGARVPPSREKIREKISEIERTCFLDVSGRRQRFLKKYFFH